MVVKQCGLSRLSPSASVHEVRKLLIDIHLHGLVSTLIFFLILSPFISHDSSFRKSSMCFVDSSGIHLVVKTIWSIFIHKCLCIIFLSFLFSSNIFSYMPYETVICDLQIVLSKIIMLEYVSLLIIWFLLLATFNRADKEFS